MWCMPVLVVCVCVRVCVSGHNVGAARGLRALGFRAQVRILGISPCACAPCMGPARTSSLAGVRLAAWCVAGRGRVRVVLPRPGG